MTALPCRDEDDQPTNLGLVKGDPRKRWAPFQTLKRDSRLLPYSVLTMPPVRHHNLNTARRNPLVKEAETVEINPVGFVFSPNRGEGNIGSIF